MVSYATSTYLKSNEFHKKLTELQKSIKPAVIRAYLINAELSFELSEDEKAKLDELKELRMSAIRGEMKYVLAQAKRNGVELSEQIISGEVILPGLEKAVVEKVPSLGVYELFLPFTEEELDTNR